MVSVNCNYRFWLNECNNYLHPYIIFFNIAKCDHPFNETKFQLYYYGSVRITGYYSPMIEGSRIMLSCSYGYSLKGSNTSTCTGNGEWEPDPRKAECKGINTTKINVIRIRMIVGIWEHIGTQTSS